MLRDLIVVVELTQRIILYQVVNGLLLREHLDSFPILRYFRKHLEAELHLEAQHVCEKSVVLQLAKLRLTANAPQMSDADLRALHDEDLRPEVLREWIREERVAKLVGARREDL